MTVPPPVECPECGRVCAASVIARHRKTHEDPTALLGVAEADRDTILKLYRRGWSMRRIAAELYYSQTTVWRFLHASEGVYIRPRGGSNSGRALSADEQLRTAQLYGRGLSMAACAEALGITTSSVHERLQKLGVKSRPRGGPNYVRPAAPEPPEPS
jgi:DNA-binding NarL/FixJ family response regulator